MSQEGSSDDHGSKFATDRPCMFYKLMVDSIVQDKKLKIPKKFVKKYGHDLSTIAILTVPGSCEWPVDIYRAGKKIWLGHGWRDFLEYHSIHAGYFLIFSYEGNSKFSVFVYNLACSGTKASYMPQRSCGESNLEKQCSVAGKESVKEDHSVALFNFQYRPLTLPSQKGSSSLEKYERITPHLDVSKFLKKVQYTRNTGTQTDIIELESTDRKVLHFACEAKRTNKRKQKAKAELGLKMSRRSISSTTHVITAERDSAIRASKMCIPLNPFCRVILPPSFRYILHIPRSFATKHLSQCPLSVTLQLSDGKWWPVKCVNGGNGSAKLSKGWKKFAYDNKLEEGDICVFEVIKVKDIVLKVTIFRVREAAIPVN